MNTCPHNVHFQKISTLPTQKGLEFKIKKCTKLKWNFQWIEGIPWGRNGYFLELHNLHVHSAVLNKILLILNESVQPVTTNMCNKYSPSILNSPSLIQSIQQTVESSTKDSTILTISESVTQSARYPYMI